MKILKEMQYFILLVFVSVFALTGCQKEEVGIEEEKMSEADIENLVSKYIDEITTNCRLKSAYSMIDNDGNEYKTVKIGNQIWMAENLRSTKYSDGSSIPNVTSNSTWANLNSDAYCYYNNDPKNAIPYGCLYKDKVVTGNSQIAPIGWHMPSNEEWRTLATTVGYNNVKSLATSGTTYWNSDRGTNTTGFSNVGSGVRLKNGSFIDIKNNAVYWSCGEYISIAEFTNEFFLGAGILNESEYGFSIRLIKDNNNDTEALINRPTVSGNTINVSGAYTNNGPSVTEVGFCWSNTTAQLPSFDDNKIVCPLNSNFSASINNIIAQKAYFVRAYAKTSSTIAYSATYLVVKVPSPTGSYITIIPNS